MLQTKDSWEFKHRGKMLGALFNEPGLRQYPCVEVPLNIPFFHVEFVFNERHQSDQCWSHFIFDEIHYVLQAIEREDVVNVRISMQSKKFGAEEYDVSSIVEIVEGTDKNGRKAYLFRCSKNIIHIDSHMVESERDLSEKRTVWQRIV
jgi:hypothetical protein